MIQSPNSTKVESSFSASPLPGLGCSTAFGAALGVLMPTGGTCAIFNIMAWYLEIYLPSPAFRSSPGWSLTLETSLYFNVSEWLVDHPNWFFADNVSNQPTRPKHQGLVFLGEECFKIYSQTTKLGMFDGFWGGPVIWANREADLLLTSQGSCQRSTGVLVGTPVTGRRCQKEVPFFLKTYPCMPSA